jgi:hypothetical protein
MADNKDKPEVKKAVPKAIPLRHQIPVTKVDGRKVRQFTHPVSGILVTEYVN